MPAEEYVDAALFMGMHSADEGLRRSCKAFFVSRLRSGIVLNMEQVGRCDDVVWGYGRQVQDAYYPFMDNLHTVMDIERPAYEESDVRCGLDAGLPEQLPMHERLLLGMVLNRNGRLTSASPRLLNTDDGLPLRAPNPANGAEPSFPDEIERLYQDSLALRVSEGVL